MKVVFAPCKSAASFGSRRAGGEVTVLGGAGFDGFHGNRQTNISLDHPQGADHPNE